MFGSVLGFSAYLYLLRRVSPTMVSTYAFVNPVVAMLLGLVFAGERFTPLALAASALIVIAVAILVTTPAAAPRTAHVPRGAMPAAE